MKQAAPLTEAQKVALDKLTSAVEPEYAEFIAAEGPHVLNERIDTLM